MPIQQLASVAKAFPDIWKDIDYMRFRADRHSAAAFTERWPEAVFLPADLLRAYLRERLAPLDSGVNEDDMLARAMCACAWRPTQDIVTFDETVYRTLAATDLPDPLPSDILRRLPAWSVYVETPELCLGERRMRGFFATAGVGRRGTIWQENVNLTYVGDEGSLLSFPLWLDETSLELAVDAASLKGSCGSVPEGASLIPGLPHSVNMLIYICSYGLEDAANPGEWARAYPGPRKTKKGWRIFPPDRPKIRKIGYEFGERIRRAGNQSGTRQGKIRPHMRRCHWHSFWKGPRKDEAGRSKFVKWLPMIMVGEADESEQRQPAF